MIFTSLILENESENNKWVKAIMKMKMKMKQAQEGNSRVRLEMTNKMLRNVEMLRNGKKC